MLRTIFLFGLLLAACVLRAQGGQAPAPADSLRVQFAPAGGFFDEAQRVKLSALGATAIFYTLDGSTPGPKSQRYITPIFVDETTVVRAIATDDATMGLTCGQTYFIGEPTTELPVVSIGISPGILFNPSRGLFVEGTHPEDSLWYKPKANFWSRKEHAVHLDMFTHDGQAFHSSLTGMRLFGGMSRLFPQKSLALVARKQYGQARFDYPIFGDDAPDQFKFLVLRNSGSDFGKSHFRDGLMTALVRHWDIETQAFQPSHVYINGAYWGIYNIREKVNRFFIQDHTKGIHRDSIEVLEHYAVRNFGSRRHYQSLLDFLSRYDLTAQTHYDQVQTLMEVDNFMAHQIAQIYFDNQDAGGNIKYWRPANETGRWRWILYDTDWGYGLHDPRAYCFNSLAFHTATNGPHWPNPPWSTFLLRKLLQNAAFRHQFVNRFADALNTDFSEQRATQVVDSLYLLLHREMPRHLKRWRLSEREWEAQVDILREFAQKRPGYVRQHLAARFQTGGERTVRIRAEAGGRVLVNGNMEVSDFEGTYFANYPIQLRAVPNYGYRFVSWEDDRNAERERTADLKPDRTHRFHARFEPFSDPLEGQVVINEICPKSRKTDDWVELHNRSDQTLSLSGWVLTDLRNTFTFPDVALRPGDYVVICKSADKFRQAYPEAYNVVGGLGFGINKYEETLCLYSRLGAAVDSVAFQLPAVDTAFTLSLRLPELDNADPHNWQLRPGPGTPNAANPDYSAARVRTAQVEWMQMGLAAGVVVVCLLLLWVRHGRRTEQIE